MSKYLSAFLQHLFCSDGRSDCDVGAEGEGNGMGVDLVKCNGLRRFSCKSPFVFTFVCTLNSVCSSRDCYLTTKVVDRFLVI